DTSHIQSLYEAVLKQANKDKVDREIRERSLHSLGTMCQVAADKLDVTKVFEVILAKCKIETIQTAALRALFLALDSDVMELNAALVEATSTSLCTLIASTRRTIKLLALNATF